MTCVTNTARLVTQIAILVATVLLQTTAQSHARNSMKFDGFTANLADITHAMNSYCRKYPATLDAALSGSTLQDSDIFRAACGRGLRGKATPFGDWQFLYSTKTVPDGEASILGVLKQFQQDGKRYLLAIGQERAVRFAGQAGEEITTKPVASLNTVNEQKTWQPIFDFVRYDGSFWNVRDGSISDFSISSAAQIAPLHTIWQRQVTNGFGNLIDAMHDMNWPD